MRIYVSHSRVPDSLALKLSTVTKKALQGQHFRMVLQPLGSFEPQIIPGRLAAIGNAASELDVFPGENPGMT